MIYLDVTSACHSGLNTGIKRIQRSLHSLFQHDPNYRSVCWQSALRDYRTLTPRDRLNLEHPFSQKIKERDLHDTPIPGLLSDWQRAGKERSLRLTWPASLQQGDALIVPDLLWDNRKVFFKRRAPEGVKRVGYFHDAIALRHPKESRIDALLCARAVRTLGHFDRVVCISAEAEEDLRYFWKKFGVPTVQTLILHHPVPFLVSRPITNPNFKAREVLYVARLELYKNHLRLLEACEDLWGQGIDFSLRLIGCKSYPAQTRRILHRIELLQEKGRDVTWQPHVGEEELHTGYEQCSFTAYPSIMEGFGLPIIESLWHGRPVICGGKGALGEVASGGGCEVIDVLEKESLREALRKLLTNQEHYERLYREAQERVYLDWRGYWNDLLDGLGIKSHATPSPTC